MTPTRLGLIVLAFAGAAGGLWYVLDRLDAEPRVEQPLPEKSERSLLSLAPDRLDRLTLHRPRFNLVVRLERRADGAWQVLDPLQDLAEPMAIFSALNALYSQDWSAAPPDWSGKDLAALGLEPAELAVEVRDDQGAAQLLRVGATDYSGRWRAAQLDGVLIRVGEGLVSPLTRDTETWRDHRLQPLPPPAVARIRWVAADGSVLSLARQEDRWQVLEPFQAPLDERQAPFVERMLGARAAMLMRDKIAERPLQGDRYGTLELRGATGVYRLELYEEALAADHRAYGMVWDAEDFQILFRDPESLRSPRLLAIDPGTIVTLHVRRGEEEGIFRRVASGWSLEGHGALQPEEGGFLDALLDHGARIEGSAWLPLPAETPSGSVSYSISRTPRTDAPTLLWWVQADGSQVAAARGEERATRTEVNFDRAVGELFERIASLR